MTEQNFPQIKAWIVWVYSDASETHTARNWQYNISRITHQEPT